MKPSGALKVDRSTFVDGNVWSCGGILELGLYKTKKVVLEEEKKLERAAPAFPHGTRSCASLQNELSMVDVMTSWFNKLK